LELTFFELYRRNAAGRVVTTFVVVEHLDVMKDIGTGILAGWVDLSTNPLTLERLEEAFSDSVVMAVAAATHAAAQIVISQKSLPVMPVN
jgi:hypothetical protein